MFQQLPKAPAMMNGRSTCAPSLDKVGLKPAKPPGLAESSPDMISSVHGGKKLNQIFRVALSCAEARFASLLRGIQVL